MRQGYDYYLIVITALILLAIGLVSIYSIAYYNYLAVNVEWTRTIQYANYIDDMNSYLYPFIVLLLISLGLCIPKRLLGQNFLIKFSFLMLGVTTALTFIQGIETGLGFILAVMIVVQSSVLFQTFRKSKVVRYEKEGYTGKLGSSMLHLGVVLLIFNFVALQGSTSHITIFWGGMVLITAGSIFSFYPDRIAL